ncbi:NUDIX hydrolase domain-like protein [Haematococcus lacustris]|nr:hypothetical protein QJQ45_018121 [Haematococcus lacustris]KAJ9533438.1 hypothetical protein QJQ45_026482 [Haematococcus lacustris]
MSTSASAAATSCQSSAVSCQSTAAMALSVGGPQPVEARTGRHQQRYAASGERLVAGCIPVRIKSGVGPEPHVDVLMISSRGGKGLCFPKGGWESDETVDNAARRETVEEAGVRGILEEPMLGVFPFQSGKPGNHTNSAHGGKCIAYMYVLHVEEELATWPESLERERFWLPLVNAVNSCRHSWMRQALIDWVRHRGWHHVLQQAEEQAAQSAAAIASVKVCRQEEGGQQGEGCSGTPSTPSSKQATCCSKEAAHKEQHIAHCPQPHAVSAVSAGSTGSQGPGDWGHAVLDVCDTSNSHGLMRSSITAEGS